MARKKKEILQSPAEERRRDEEINRLFYEILYLDEDPYGYSLKAKYKVRNKQILRVLAEYLSNRRIKLIDFGSGTGQLMKLVGRAFPLIEITCVEPSPKAVEALKEAGCFSVIQSALPYLSGVSGLYDCATCFDTFWYLKNKESRNEAAAIICRILEPKGRFIVDDCHADDLDSKLFQIEKTHHFDGETITNYFFFLIENRYRMLKHILSDSHRGLFERFDFYRNRSTTKLILRHRYFFKTVYVLAKPIVWVNRVFIGNVTIRRLLSALQKNSYKIHVFRKVDSVKPQANI